MSTHEDRRADAEREAHYDRVGHPRTIKGRVSIERLATILPGAQFTVYIYVDPDEGATIEWAEMDEAPNENVREAYFLADELRGAE